MEWQVTRYSDLSLDVVTRFEAYIAFGSRYQGKAKARYLSTLPAWYGIGSFCIVVYTWRGDNRRIISAWKVGEDGKRRYTALLSR